MTASAHTPLSSVRGIAGSRTRWADFILRAFSAFAAERVLITAILPSLELGPGMCCENFLERTRRKHFRGARLPIAVAGVRDAGQQPHGEQRNRCPNGVTRLSDKTTAAG